MKIKEIEDKGRSPFLIVDVEASAGQSDKPAPKEQILMYGHMDKQPYGDGWETHPCDPVIKDDRLYGRGSSDDGYAFFTAILTIKAC
jgi:acetylornithine deacetylase/succinyl-diaminopimelate desuccinylase-like protein